MRELISKIVDQAGVSEAQATGGAALLMKAARDKLGTSSFDQLLGGLPGMAALLEAAPRSGGMGRLFGGLASAVGGDRAAMIAAIVGGFGKLGMTSDHAKAFAPIIVEHLRTQLDPASAQRIEQLLRT